MSSWFTSVFRRIRFGEPILIVSGLPRSGTSMAMKMLDAAGFPVVIDGIRVADEDNPKGYFEDERVKDLASMADKDWIAEGRGRVIKVISYLLKELPDTNNYKVVFMRRELEEVLASQQTMLERREEGSETSDEKMIEIFKDHLWKVGYLLRHRSQFEHIDINYSDVLADPLHEAQRLAAFLPGSPDPHKMAAVVDPTLYRNRAEDRRENPGSTS